MSQSLPSKQQNFEEVFKKRLKHLFFHSVNVFPDRKCDIVERYRSKTDLGKLKMAGFRPMFLGLIVSVTVNIVSLAVQYALGLV